MEKIKEKLKLWELVLHGAASSAIGGALTAVANLCVSPDLEWHAVLKVAGIGAVVSTAAYFLHSPLGKTDQPKG